MSERALPTPEDDNDRELLDDIEGVGWAVLGIPEDEEGPTFTYTLGLFHTLNHPEILIMGVEITTAQHLLNNLGELIRAGRRFVAGSRCENVVKGFALGFVAVPRKLYPEYVGYGGWLYGGMEFPLLQCVWPDKSGRFPWEAEYDTQLFQLQRLLGPVGDLTDGWLFPDPPNQATFTTRQIMQQGKPILYVVHDAEGGSWQFLPGDPVSVEDAMLVSLASIVKHDPSVAELGNLPPGKTAERRAPGEEWQCADQEKGDT